MFDNVPVIFTMSLDSDDELEYKLLTRDKVEDVLAIQAETMKQENLAIGLGMFEDDGAPEEMNLLFREVIKDGMTLIAVDKKTDQVAAVAFNKLHVIFHSTFIRINLPLPFSPNLSRTFEGETGEGWEGRAGYIHWGEPEAWDV